MFRTIGINRGGQALGKWESWVTRLAHAIDAYAAYRIQRAVPQGELRRAKREITRFAQR